MTHRRTRSEPGASAGWNRANPTHLLSRFFPLTAVPELSCVGPGPGSGAGRGGSERAGPCGPPLRCRSPPPPSSCCRRHLCCGGRACARRSAAVVHTPPPSWVPGKPRWRPRRAHAVAAILVFQTPKMAAARGRRRRSGVRMCGCHNKDGGHSGKTAAAEIGTRAAAHTGQRAPNPRGRRRIRAQGPHRMAPEPR